MLIKIYRSILHLWNSHHVRIFTSFLCSRSWEHEVEVLEIWHKKKSTFLRFCPYRNQFLTFLWPFSKEKFIFPVCGNRKPLKWALVDVWIFIRSRVILFPENKRRFRPEWTALIIWHHRFDKSNIVDLKWRTNV